MYTVKVGLFGGWGVAPDRPKAVAAFGLSEGEAFPSWKREAPAFWLFGFGLLSEAARPPSKGLARARVDYLTIIKDYRRAKMALTC